MGGDERVARQHASGRLTVRERIERLFDAGHLPRDRRAGRARRPTATTASSRTSLPANMVVGHGPDRRPPRRRPGRRLHRARRRRRRRHLGEVRVGRARGARAAHAARAAGRRHGRRGQRQDARARWASPTCRRCPGCELVVENLATRPGGRRRARPVSPASAPRASWPRTSAVIVRGTAQLFVAGPPVVAAADGRGARQGGARRRARADARRRGRQRGRRRGGRARPDPALPLLPARQRLGGAAGAAATDPPDRREEELLSIVPRDRAQALRRCARMLELGLRPRLGVRARRALRPAADHRAGPARRAARSACSPPTRSTTAAG